MTYTYALISTKRLRVECWHASLDFYKFSSYRKSWQNRELCQQHSYFFRWSHLHFFPCVSFSTWPTRNVKLIFMDGCGQFSAGARKLPTYLFFWHAKYNICIFILILNIITLLDYVFPLTEEKWWKEVEYLTMS